MIRRLVAPVALALALAALAPPARAAWEEPKDGLLTEKEVEAYLASIEKIGALYADFAAKWEAEKKAGKEPQGVDAVARMKRVSDAIDEAKAKSGLEPREYEWVSGRVSEAHGLLLMTKTAQANADAQAKATDDKVAAATKDHDAAVAQRKAGRRPMSADELADARKAAEQEAKDAEAPLADAKEDAKAATAAARDALKQAEQSEADASAAVDRARRKAASPDVPQSDDEKRSLEQDLAQREADTKQALDDANAEKGRSQQAQAMVAASMGEMAKSVKEPNLALVAKVDDRYDRALRTLLGGQQAVAPPTK